jgi:NAD(P)H-nitrite reductase large subunit
MCHYVIIGDGVTGTRAAETLRRRDQGASITILTEEAYPFYRRPLLPDYAAMLVPEARLWGKTTDFYRTNKLELRLGTRVTRLDPVAHRVYCGSGENFAYDRLLVATGRRFETEAHLLPGAVAPNGFRTLDDARSIRSMVEAGALGGAGKTAAVYGNGLVALAMLRALTRSGFATHYLVPTETLWPEVLDKEAAAIVASRIRAAGATLQLGATVDAVGGADVVGICAGYTPSVDFLPDGGRGFQADAGFRTPWEDIYAAGDVTAPSGRHYFNWLRSWRQGAAVGEVMAAPLPDDEVPVVTVDVDILNMTVLGLSLGAIGRTTVEYRSGYTEMRGDYPAGEFYKKLVFDPEGILVGALLLGSIAEAGALEEAIRARAHKEQLAPALLHQLFDVTYKTTYQGVQCPVCKHEIQLGKDARAGDAVTCPVCGVEFVLEQGEQALRVRLAK